MTPIYMQVWRGSGITQQKYKCLSSGADPPSAQTLNLIMVCKLLKSLEANVTEKILCALH